MRLTWLILHRVQRHRCAPEAECPYLVITCPHAGHLGVFIPPTMKQPTSMWIFPHQQAKKSLQNQHVLSILQVGSHQLQYRFFRTKKPKSHHKTNTFCPIAPFCPITPKLAAQTARGRAAAHRHTQRPGPTTRPSRRPEHQRHQSTQQQAPHERAQAYKKPTSAIGCRPVVELGGFEPPTFSLRTRRATNCAIAPRTHTA